jgi:hypothetical protein
MLKKILLILLVSFGCYCSASAQDVIHKKGGEKIKCKITQVTPEEITYKLLDEVDGPTYTIDKAKVVKVVYQSGRIESYVSNSSINDPELYADQLKKAIKVDFIAPQLGYFQVSFEKSLKPGTSYEVDLAILGAGRNITVGSFYEGNNQFRVVKRGAFGVALSGGYKFSKLPNYISRGTRYAHIMQGSYAKPIATIGAYKENYANDLVNNVRQVRTRNVLYGSLGVNLGRQWIFGSKFLLDINGNIGYMADNKKYDDNNNNSVIISGISNNFTGTRFGTGAGVTVGIRLKVGILIK